MAALDLALIGGSGLYAFPALEGVEKRVLDTPWGAPSGPVVLGRVHGHKVAFLARHGEQHQYLPHRVNYRANLWALHELGAERVVGINAVGGIRADMAPSVIAIPDQIIDYTSGRATSYADAPGADVQHIDFSEPYTASLRAALRAGAAKAGIPVVDGGCYGATQGPRLETRAEIARMRRDGCDLVGMTGMPEAALARELGVAYASLALVANWAAGCDPEGTPEVSVEAIYARLKALTGKALGVVEALLA